MPTIARARVRVSSPPRDSSTPRESRSEFIQVRTEWLQPRELRIEQHMAGRHVRLNDLTTIRVPRASSRAIYYHRRVAENPGLDSDDESLFSSSSSSTNSSDFYDSDWNSFGEEEPEPEADLHQAVSNHTHNLRNRMHVGPNVRPHQAAPALHRLPEPEPEQEVEYLHSSHIPMCIGCDSLDIRIALSCGHCFCLACSRRCLETPYFHGRCFVCRQQVEYFTVLYL